MISDWHERDLKTVADIQSYITASKQKQANIKDLKKQTNYNNSHKRNYENFDNIYANA